MPIHMECLTDPSDEQLSKAANVLHEAFQRKYFLPLLGGDQSLIEPFLLAHVKAAVIGGQVYVAMLANVGIVGVALWFGPGEKFLSSPEQFDAGWKQILGKLDHKHQTWWKKFLVTVDEVADKLYGPGQQRAAYHLQTFGVLPEYQKKGYGTALMKTVEKRAVEEHTDVVLETLGESAVPVYEKMGFQVLGPVPVNTGGGEMNGYGFRKSFK